MYGESAEEPLPGRSAGSPGLLVPGTDGIWCFTAHATVLGAIARSRCGWLALDAQHGEFDRRALVESGRLLSSAGRAFAVRVAGPDAAGIGFALDVGASTVIVPQVDTVEQARLAAAAAHYPPAGERSWGPLAPLWGLPAPRADTAAPQVAVMIESARALAEVERIAEVADVDLLFIGPFDLALSLGVGLDDLLAGELDAISRIRFAAEAAGIPVAAFGGSPERNGRLRELGIDCLAISTDTAIVEAGIEVALTRS